MSKIEAINGVNTYGAANQKSDKKAALIGAGAGLGTGAAVDAINISYKANQFVKQNKEKNVEVKFTEGLKQVWNAFKEHGNATWLNLKYIPCLINP